GRKIKFNLIIQSISQLKKLYGDDYKTIMGNCSNKFYIFTNEIETAEEFAKLLGDETIVTYSRSGEILDITKHQTESVDGKKLLTVDELMHLKEGEVVLVRGTKRRDLEGNEIRPYPIFNTGETKLKYRYEYLSAFFDNTKNLLNKKVSTLHEKVNLEDLLLCIDIKKPKIILEKDIIKDEVVDENKIYKILINQVFSTEEYENIIKKSGMFVKTSDYDKLDFGMKWLEFKSIIEEYDIEELKEIIKQGEQRIENWM
ncbi:MAG: TraG/TraD/VirD4 family protein, partial [Bacilli bacterium]